MPPMPDVRAILKTLAKHTVEFLVIGGVAVAHHGYVRTTKDIDIVPEPSEDNLSHLWDACSRWRQSPSRSANLRPEELPARLTLDGLRAVGNWDLTTNYGRLD